MLLWELVLSASALSAAALSAEAAPGVALVMTHRNAPKMAVPPPIGMTNLKAAGNHTLPIMQDAEIRWNGEVVAVVLAGTREQADHAATLIRVGYDTAPATPWPNAKTVHGYMRKAGNLTYATVLRTGHLVPTVVPAAFATLLELLLQ